jgi:hypothetical protein
MSDPDRSGVVERLAAERTDLLGRIDVPELGQIRSRARAVRRRRYLASGSAALALATVLGVVVARDQSSGPTRHPEPAATSEAPFQAIWHGSGLTLYGLSATTHDVPGDIVDVQFTDPDRGYALAAECPGGHESCDLTLAVTSDAGRTWRNISPPIRRVTAFSKPSLALVPLTGGRIALVSGDEAWVRDRGSVWTHMQLSEALLVQAADSGETLWIRPSDACAAQPVYVWQAGNVLLRLAEPPPIQACRITHASDGSWWAGGFVSSAKGRLPAVAVTRDGGATWQSFELPASGEGAFAQVAPLGADVYASVVTPSSYVDGLVLRAVYRSAAGRPFLAYGSGSTTMVGEVVPLLDGRLVVAAPDWYVGGPNAPFQRNDGELPYVRRLARTPGGWIAYDLFQAGWTAISHNGQDWHKLNIR